VIAGQATGYGGFGYDPVFYLPRQKKTVAELDLETKNRISHRANAFVALKPFISGMVPAP
jgi:XTP/dITP diphosphohydrolase